MNMRSLTAVATFAAVLLTQGAGEAAEVTVLAANPMRSILNELAPRFERETGHKLEIKYETMAPLIRRIEGGEQFDVLLMTQVELIDELAKRGKIAAGTQAPIGRSAIGMIVRTGATKPDISSTEGFKRALLSAKSITYTAEGGTGMYLPTLFDRLGIAQDIKAKIKTQTVGARTPQAVAAGEADIGLGAISSFADLPPGAELLGTIPSELQLYSVYAGALSASTRQADAGKALLAFLTSPAAAPVIKAKGLEPAASQ
jgi:molybdate transport system substrate-binding protein